MRIPVRYLLVVWTFSLSVLLYVDRICISTAKVDIARDLNFDDRQMGWVLSIFALGYALFQTPSGWLADRLGPRMTLSATVIFWSIFTGLTAIVTNLWGMLITRFLFGAGEAGAFPAVARAIYSWVPVAERGLIQGINFSGSRVGGALSLVILPALIAWLGWKGAFVSLMFLGIVWAAGWYSWFRNDPHSHPRMTREELALIAVHRPPSVESTENTAHGDFDRTTNQAIAHPSISLWQLATSWNLWMVSLQYFCSNFTFFFCLTWLFPHLNATYRLSGIQAGLYSAAPLCCGAAGNWFSGWLVDRLYRAGYRNASRQIPAMFGFALATIGVLGSVQAGSALSSIAWFSLAIFGADMTISPSWSVCIDIGRHHAGMVSGTMNMAGNLGSFLTALAFPYLAAWTGSNTYFFFIAAALNLAAIALWLFVDSRHTIQGMP